MRAGPSHPSDSSDVEVTATESVQQTHAPMHRTSPCQRTAGCRGCRASHRCTRQSETCHTSTPNGGPIRLTATCASSSDRQDGTLATIGTQAPARPAQPSRIVTASAASSIACASTGASQLRVLCPRRPRAANPVRARRPDLRAKADNASSTTVRRIPLTVDTVPRATRTPPSAWPISATTPAATSRTCVSDDRFVGRRGHCRTRAKQLLSDRPSKTDSSATSRPDLCGDVTRSQIERMLSVRFHDLGQRR